MEGVGRTNIQRKQTHELVHSFVQLSLSTTVLGAEIQIKDMVAAPKKL